MEDEDLILALKLQEQFDKEALTPHRHGFPLSKRPRVDTSDWPVVHPQTHMSIVDERWELLDPSPDVRGMFLQFNDMFFWGKLSGVEVKWSPRMTLCAGICAYEGRGGLCSIRLSEPILKLRPRKDLVETLLHEMIHALLFVTQNNRDRDGHGPEFCKHMNRINTASGTKISIYHTFHDEVDVYRQHWWRCDGPCQNRKPFFGYVKRAMNRAPSARDPWWEDHRRSCGGTFTKIKEPENYGKKGKNEEKKDKSALNKQAGKIKPASSTTGSQDIRNIIPFSGRGFVLGGSTQPSASIQKPPSQSPTLSLRTPEEQVKPSPSSVESQTSLSPSDWRISSNIPGLPKRSVGNTKAFININGSPVRITKDNSSLMRPKQKTVQDLFQSKSLSSPQKAPATTSAAASSSQPSKTPDLGSALVLKASDQTSEGTNCPSANLFNKTSNNSVGPKPGSAGPLLSKYFGSPKNSPPGMPGFGGLKKPENALGANSKHYGSSKWPDSQVPASVSRAIGSPHKSASGGRKRSWEDHNSAHIFDFFQRVKQPSASSSSSSRELSDRGRADGVTTALPASSTSNSSTAVTVHCPVCQSKVLESQINEHLDSCLM